MKSSKVMPKQEIGGQMDVIEQISLVNEEAAIDFFLIVRERLLAVNNWGKLAGTALSAFQLTNSFGNRVDRLVEIGDYIKIDIPGPGTVLGRGYDWVKVEQVIEHTEPGMEKVAIVVKPANNPLSGSSVTAHFLTHEASSTFLIKRVGRHIYAEEHGRNEQPNVYMPNTIDNLRNMLVGWAAVLGFSYPQWKALVRGLLQGN